MRKALRVGAIVAAFALTAWIGLVALAQGSPTQAPTTSTRVSDGDHFKGRCDEAEHANDPECAGVTLVSEDDEANDDAGDRAEHENGDDQGENNDDQGEDEQGDENDDQGGNDDHQGNDNDDQGENDDHQGENDNSGPINNSGSGDDQGEDD